MELTLDQFIKNKGFKDGYDTLCRSCNRSRVKEWRKKNPDKRAVQQQREGKKDYCHNKHLKHQYGITHQDWQDMFEEQRGCCAICQRHQSEFKKRLFVDHDHTTGKIRQLLCFGCNSILGYAFENTQTLEKAIAYLEKHKQDTRYGN